MATGRNGVATWPGATIMARSPWSGGRWVSSNWPATGWARLPKKVTVGGAKPDAGATGSRTTWSGTAISRPGAPLAVGWRLTMKP